MRTRDFIHESRRKVACGVFITHETNDINLRETVNRDIKQKCLDEFTVGGKVLCGDLTNAFSNVMTREHVS